jgi:hypothetical protein
MSRIVELLLLKMHTTQNQDPELTETDNQYNYGSYVTPGDRKSHFSINSLEGDSNNPFDRYNSMNEANVEFAK